MLSPISCICYLDMLKAQYTSNTCALDITEEDKCQRGWDRHELAAQVSRGCQCFTSYWKVMIHPVIDERLQEGLA